MKKMEEKFEQKKIIDFDKDFKKSVIKWGSELGVLVFVDDNKF